MPAPPVAHVVRDWLPRSATFVYTTLRCQRRVRPVVLAFHASNRAEFPFAPVHELLPPRSPAALRVLRRAAARAAGWPGTLDHRLAAAAQREGCVAIHAHFGPTALPALAARERLGLPLVTTFYGFDVGLAARDGSWVPRYARLFAAGDAFTVEGPAMAERLVEAGAPPERVHVVRIGLELDKFPYEPRPQARPLVVMQVARFVPKKGLDVTIDAFARALPELGAAELWLVGDGPLEAQLRERAECSGAGGSIRFLGSLSHAEYRERLARVDIGIQPSRTAPDGDTEGGAPTVLLELQAAGIPVVATRHADIPQVVAAPEELAEEEDAEGVAAALLRLAALTPEQRRTRQDAGRALVERRHDARVTAAQLEDLYLELRARPT